MNEKKSRAVTRLAFITAKLLNSVEIKTIKRCLLGMIKSALSDPILPKNVRNDIHTDLLGLSRSVTYSPTFLTPEVMAFQVSSMMREASRRKQQGKSKLRKQHTTHDLLKTYKPHRKYSDTFLEAR